MPEHVYSRFEVTKTNGTKVKLRIQDMRDHDMQDVIEFMQKYFISEETMFRAAGIANSEASVQWIKKCYHALMQDERSKPLVCYTDDEDNLQIVGCSLLRVKRKEGEASIMVETEECKALLRIVKVYDSVYDLGTKIEEDEYLRGFGLCVDPAYRGCGIATELFKARKPLIQRRSFKITSVWLTSIGSQKAAVKAGYEEVAEITYEELGRRAGVTFTDCPPTAKYMVLRA